MRGKDEQSTAELGETRITPAYAGKSLMNVIGYMFIGDHPRLCGEKHPLLPPPFHDIGSPPPMRGKGRRSFFDRNFHGITPASAGKSRTVCGIRSKLEDHPRLCGEKHTTLIFMFSCSGSPPPMRGKEVDL